MIDDVTIEARGRWQGILAAFGVPSRSLDGKHHPCPVCGGKDRFRFTDLDGKGKWICNQHGHGDGFDLLEQVRGWSKAETFQEVKAMVGEVEPTAQKPELSDEKRREMVRDLWRASKPVQQGDLVDVYLRSRGIALKEFPKSLRFCPECKTGGEAYPAMISAVVDKAGRGVSLHRTFLAPDGRGKAAMEAPRKLMPGSLPDGACVRLSGVQERIGVAEGIETALSAGLLDRLPVWALLSAHMMEGWEPPEGVKSVVIFSDADANYRGQRAAYYLAHSLAGGWGLEVSVRMPPTLGVDWNDLCKNEPVAA